MCHTLKHTLLLITLAILPMLQGLAATEKDFVAQMMEAISNQPDTYPATDYRQITVSPTMMKSVVEMMSQNSNHLSGTDAQNQEIYSRLLKCVKSLRIFLATNNQKAYTRLARRVVSNNKTIYKAFKATSNEEKRSDRHIWTRHSGGKVVEIVMLTEEDPRHKALQILNLTGDFTDDFISLLLQMP